MADVCAYVMKRTPIKNEKELWSDGGPYSQVNLKVQRRVLDDRMARTFLYVEAEINPYTFRFVKKHRAEFKSDQVINAILDSSDFWGWQYGYVSNPFCCEISGWPSSLNDALVFNEANRMLAETEQAIIRMHKFVLQHLKKQN